VFGLCAHFKSYAGSVVGEASPLKSLWIFTFLLLLAVPGIGAEKIKPNVQRSSSASKNLKKIEFIKVQVVSDTAAVYKKPNFDSEILGELDGGKVITVSKQKIGGVFHLIQLPKGKRAYIAETDLSTFYRDQAKRNSIKREVPFIASRFRGLSYSLLQFTEDTMATKASQSLGFLGLKLSGPGVMWDGVPTEVDFMYYGQAPKYYAKATGRNASGFIFISDFLFTTPMSQGKNYLNYFGFGPMFKFSHFDVTLNNTAYALEDMQLGAVFNFGLAFRISSFSYRTEIKYHWERVHYWGWVNGFSFEF
jgi:hypothetical protein